MSRFDERVKALIEDRVNDLERLFLSSESGGDRAASMEECCHEVLDKLNDTKEKVDRILEKLRQDNNDPTRRRDVLPDDIGDRSDTDPERWEPLVNELRRYILEHYPYELPSNDDGRPLTLPDPNQLPVPTWGESVPGHIMGTLYRGLLRLAKPLGVGALELLDWLPKLRGYLQLVRALIDLQNSLGLRTDETDRDKLPEDLYNQLKKTQDRIDALAPLINALTVPGGSSQPILDRLNEIFRLMDDTLGEVQELDRKIDDYDVEMHNSLRDGFNLISAQEFIIKDMMSCANRWIFGNRSCEDFDSDIISRLDVLQNLGAEIRCALTDYYQTFSDRFTECCSTLNGKLDDIGSSTRRIETSLLDPGNPIDQISSDLDKGNVVGTGSLVLNYQQDLDQIKSMLSEIRRLL